MFEFIRAGTLRHKITLDTITGSTTSTVGQVITAYATVGTFYALVEQQSASETDNNDQKKGVRKYKVTMRNSTTIKPSDIIYWNGHRLNIEGATVDPFGVKIEIDATELITPQ